MRVVIKRPGLLPEVADIREGYEALQRALGEPGPPVPFEQCLKDAGSIVWCDEEYLLRSPRPELNFFRPMDAHPIFGTVVVTGTRMTVDEGLENDSLDEAEADRWCYILTALSPISFDVASPFHPSRHSASLDALWRKLTPAARVSVVHLDDDFDHEDETSAGGES